MLYYSIINFIAAAFTIYQFMIIIYIFMSWVPNIRNSTVGEYLGKLVEPYLGIFRKFIPPIGMIDISPIVALLLLRYIQMGLLIVVEKVYFMFA
ncbi:YggT family protein [Lysinibacillus endophyticus]|uniref:YggT family protein n=1 Tax=Ureibacillus endophyticus TaxID=1978490 RepID=A0A494ZAJ1_9BACL|nr:YggT family protein [Lysinibacillus endophyticus]MCP1143954.1 YggT family protein [Lysinibacillus endophyticus]RKQ19719.1 YggT family protein [Lysinibacillus endophyticus]